MVQLKRLGQADLTLPNPSQDMAQASTSHSQNSPFGAKRINSPGLEGFGSNLSCPQRSPQVSKRGEA